VAVVLSAGVSARIDIDGEGKARQMFARDVGRRRADKPWL
jgi:hypothetical protein